MSRVSFIKAGTRSRLAAVVVPLLVLSLVIGGAPCTARGEHSGLTLGRASSLHMRTVTSALRKGSRPVRIYMAYADSPASYTEFSRAARRVGRLLRERISRPVVVVIVPGDAVRSQDKLLKALRKGVADVAWLGWPAYLSAHNLHGAEAALATVRGDQAFYQSQIVARIDSGVDEVEDLEGKSLCWAEPLSASGYVVPSLMLRAAGVDPDANARFTGAHFQVIMDVYDRLCEGGGTYVDARDRVRHLDEYPNVDDVVEVIDVSAPLPNTGFCLADDVPSGLGDEIVEALLAISVTEEGKELFEVLTGSPEGLWEVDHDLYGDLEDLIESAGLEPEEVWEVYYH